MKSKLFLLSLLVTTSLAQASESISPTLLAPLLHHPQAAHLSARILTESHYKALPLDDAMSEKIFDNYIKSLDPNKLFFTQTDINEFSNLRTKFDDAIRNGILNPPYYVFNTYQQRVVEQLVYVRQLLKQNFDFNKKEFYQYDRSKEAWPKSKEEINDLWRKRVKNDFLLLKLAGQKDQIIRERLDKRYGNSLAFVNKNTSEDVFQIFMNAYTTSIEPHTNYFAPRAVDNFNISMKLSLVGIGATLQLKDEYTTIRELVQGGPAALSGKLNPGDRIVGVGQGENGPLVDVIGWRIDDVVSLIRGDKGTRVLLDILPAEGSADGKHKLVVLVRDKINLEQQAAKKTIIQVKNGETVHSVGVITLPTFYRDFEARNNGEKEFRSATRDVARLLDALKKEKVESVLIDLRNNGGGSLTEAVDLTGLFIKRGPVVQQRNSDGDINVEKDKDSFVAWEGLMGVLINRGSASASEIFAAAIQDYGRGVVIGESSFGKGTVQSLIDLDEFVQTKKPVLGELKITTAQFFRINGGTTQLRGVIPDITLPSMLDADSFGESSFDNALPWVQIKALSFKSEGNVKKLLPLLQARHDARILKNKEFQYLLEDIAELKEERKKNQVSLNETERRKQREKREARLKTRVSEGEKNKAVDLQDELTDDGLLSNERDINADLASEKMKKNAKDVLLEEATAILADTSSILKTDARFTAQIIPNKIKH